VNGYTMDALIDSCSSDSFISESAFRKLNIPMAHSANTVSMALTSMESTVIGRCQLTFALNKYLYKNVKVGIFENLCSDIILGHDFQKQHEKLTFQFGGFKPDLVIAPKMQPNISALPDNSSTEPEPATSPEPAVKSEPELTTQANRLPTMFADVATTR